MRQIVIRSCRVTSVLCLALVLSGCISAKNSPTPRFICFRPYMKKQVSKKMNIASDVVIGLGPVRFRNIRTAANW